MPRSSVALVWSSLIWHEEEDFPSNVGLSKPKMTTSATLGLGKNCPHNKYFIKEKRNIV